PVPGSLPVRAPAFTPPRAIRDILRKKEHDRPAMSWREIFDHSPRVDAVTMQELRELGASLAGAHPRDVARRLQPAIANLTRWTTLLGPDAQPAFEPLLAQFERAFESIGGRKNPTEASALMVFLHALRCSGLPVAPKLAAIEAKLLDDILEAGR